jgi:hypothetical protein
MHPNVKELLRHIQALEDEIEQEVRRRREELHADFEHRAVQFEAAVAEQQKRFKAGLLHYVLTAELRHVVTMPVILLLLFSMLLLDATICLYQALCFPLYGIARVRRRSYWNSDRSHLPYLNLVEKINCAYCSYANGLVGFFREVAARTEQYRCPIKHARRIPQPHGRYSEFFDFGDGEAFRQQLQVLRQALRDLDSDPG